MVAVVSLGLEAMPERQETMIRVLERSVAAIERSFVTDISDRPENRAIVDATIAMATHLNVDCIVEGVETEGDVAYFHDKPVRAMRGGPKNAPGRLRSGLEPVKIANVNAGSRSPQ